MLLICCCKSSSLCSLGRRQVWKLIQDSHWISRDGDGSCSNCSNRLQVTTAHVVCVLILQLVKECDNIWSEVTRPAHPMVMCLPRVSLVLDHLVKGGQNNIIIHSFKQTLAYTPMFMPTVGDCSSVWTTLCETSSKSLALVYCRDGPLLAACSLQ